MRTSVMVGLTLWLLSGGRIAAQDSSLTLQPGQVIRVSGDQKFRFTGEYLGQDSTGLVIRPADGHRRKVPFAWIKKVEIRTGHESGAGKGALIGGGTGAVLGLVAVVGVDNSSYFGDTCCSEEEYASGGVLFAAAGAGLGAIVGAMTHKDTWRRVPPEAWQVNGNLLDSSDTPIAERQKHRSRPSRPR